MRFTPALLAFVLAACHRSNDAQRSGQVRYEGHTLAEWWAQRHNVDATAEADFHLAMHMIGGPAVPFLAEKAMSHDMDDMIQGSTALESMCPSALPALRAERERNPSASPVLDAAIRRIQFQSATRVGLKLCAPNGDPLPPGGQR